jgi:hypothetical protein
MMGIKRCQDLEYIFVIYETDSKSTMDLRLGYFSLSARAPLHPIQPSWSGGSTYYCVLQCIVLCIVLDEKEVHLGAELYSFRRTIQHAWDELLAGSVPLIKFTFLG